MSKRFSPNIKIGLTNEQIESRFKDELVNHDTSVPTKTEKQIITTNIFTLFNILNFILAGFIILVGSHKNLLFLGVVFCNTIISIIQELRAKKEIDELSKLNQVRVTVIRNSKSIKIPINEVVLDDIIKVTIGDQIVTDSVVQQGSCEVDESFITGESDTVFKNTGEMLLSGSFIVSGTVIAKVEHIGEDNYTSKIVVAAKYKKISSSILMKSLNTIIKWISILIIPIGIFLFLNQYSVNNHNLSASVVATVAAIIGMIPEGLILLTSTVLAVSAIRLSKYKVLVKDLYSIETLARIDTLCLDKTGTITNGEMKFMKVIPYIKHTKKEIEEIMNAFVSATEDSNSTMEAIKEYYNKKLYLDVTNKIPFSSASKYSAITFKENGTYFLGSPEHILKDKYYNLEKVIKNDLLEYRILLLAHTNKEVKKDYIPGNVEIIGLLYLQDEIRENIKETLKIFKKQNVEIKLISGDNVKTVSGIAKRAGVDNWDNYIDVSNLSDKELIKVATKYTVFGRVSPTQKKELIKALKDNGKFVAMTGDGVNDVLALREANCSIAMPSGSDAAKNIAEIVLLNSDFSSMTKIVDEGRRTINNIEKSATLFLTKTTYATILALVFLFINFQYPFMPIQLTLTSVVTIGIPSFVLAIQPNYDSIKGNFFKNVLSKSLPAGILVVLNILTIIFLSQIFKFTDIQISTLCVFMAATTGFILLYYLCFPFNILKKILFISMIILFFLQIVLLKDLFSLTTLNFPMLIIILILCMLTITLFKIFEKFFYKNIKKDD